MPINDLCQEIFHVAGRFRAQFGISDYRSVSADTLMRRLASDIAEVKRAVRDLTKEFLAFEDVKKLKAWLKEMRHSARHDSHDFDDCPF